MAYSLVLETSKIVAEAYFIPAFLSSNNAHNSRLLPKAAWMAKHSSAETGSRVLKRKASLASKSVNMPTELTPPTDSTTTAKTACPHDWQVQWNNRAGPLCPNNLTTDWS